jgi:hypothetical protein
MEKMSKLPVHTTVGELIAGLFDETRHLHWLKRREKQLLVAYILNDLARRSMVVRNHDATTMKYL